MCLSGGRPFWMSWSGRESLPDNWVWPGGPPGCPGVDECISRMFESGQETRPDVREWSGDPPVCPGEVE